MEFKIKTNTETLTYNSNDGDVLTMIEKDVIDKLKNKKGNETIVIGIVIISTYLEPIGIN